jgi:succinate dehydrogenase/fumarate reductase flavoprotein subunit
MAPRIIETDVVVVGAGMAGLVSAVRALENDADVIVLEKGPQVGGKGVWSAGAIMVDEDEDPRVDTYEPLEASVEWLEEIEANVKEMTLEVPWTGIELDMPDFSQHMAGRIESMGGELRLETPFKELKISDEGEVAGAIARDDDGLLEIDAPNVILAAGGFNANEELIERYITEHTDEIVLRGDPWSTGDGFLAALEEDAKTTKGLSKFDGHPMIAPPAKFSPEEFEEATQYYGARAIALDRRGHRFIDESIDIFERPLIDAMAKRAEGKTFCVIGRDIYDDSWVNGSVATMIERAKEFGGLVLEAETLDELCEKLSDHGVNGKRSLDTIREFNEAVEDDRGEQLDPPRGDHQEPINEAPLYAIEVRPGLTFTMGGLDVNHNAEVLSRSSSTTTLIDEAAHPDHHFYKPIKGLYATGVEIGNPNPGYYAAGGLSLALASGRIAGKHAADRARKMKDKQATD